MWITFSFYNSCILHILCLCKICQSAIKNFNTIQKAQRIFNRLFLFIWNAPPKKPLWITLWKKYFCIRYTEEMRFYGLFVMSNVDNYVDKWKNDLWSAVSEDKVL